MKMQKSTYIKGLVVAILASCSVFSQFTMASAQNACQNVSEVTEQVDTSTCFQFVTGFLEGALLSDEQIMSNLGSTNELSDFTKRAMRTRLGKASEPLPATYLADFCLPEAKASDEVVLTVLDALKDVEDKSRISSTMIYLIIKREFPCS